MQLKSGTAKGAWIAVCGCRDCGRTGGCHGICAAKNGAKPLVVTNTTFIQRAYDQISHDVCINNSSVTILLNYNSFDSLTDVTHSWNFGLAAYIECSESWLDAC